MNPAAHSSSRRPVSSQSSRIEDVAADWLARREAGLSAEEQAEFSRWLLAHPSHARTVESLATTWRRLQKPRLTGQADAVVQAIEARVGQRARRARRRVLAGMLVGTLAAAAALAVVFFPAKPTPASPDSVVTSVSIRPERRTLADGSIVELNAGAEIAVSFSIERRQVRLVRGEAHFTVSTDATRPFIVTAGAVVVRAVGTEFAVQLAPDTVGVLVTEGRVAVQRVSPAPAAAPGLVDQLPVCAPPPPVTYLDAGNRLAVSATEVSSVALQPMSVTTAEVKAALAWRELRVEFTNTSLAEVVELFNRQNQVRLALGAADLGTIRISGVFWTDDPEGFSRLIEASAGLKAERSTVGQITLQR